MGSEDHLVVMYQGQWPPVTGHWLRVCPLEHPYLYSKSIRLAIYSQNSSEKKFFVLYLQLFCMFLLFRKFF